MFKIKLLKAFAYYALVMLFCSTSVSAHQRIHVVRRGDTLSGVSQQHYGDASKWSVLHQKNPQIKNPHQIYPGNTLYSGLQNGAYIEGGLNYFRNLASGQRNQLFIQQIPGIPYDIGTYTNAKHAYGVGLYLGGGYRWIMNSKWAWSLGGRISYRSIEQKTNYDYYGTQTPYAFDVDAMLINAVVRLYWQATLRNNFYGEVSAGLANLRSQNFHSTDPTGSAAHYNKTKNNLDYGVALGWLYHLTAHTSFNVSLGYQDLGKAKLGTRIVPVRSKGDISQKLRGLNATIGLTYWF